MGRRRSRDGAVGRSAARRSDRAAAALEAGLVMPILFAVIFGIVDFGVVFNDWISVRQGARDALRHAIVDTMPAAPSGGAWSCPIAGTRPAAGSDAESLVCYTKDRVGLDQSDTRVKIYFVPPYKADRPVKICLQYKAMSTTGAYASLLSGKVLSTQVETLIEQDAPTFTGPYEEAPLTSWPASCNTL